MFEENYVVRSDEINEMINNVRLRDLGLLSISRRPIHDNPETDTLFLKILIAMTMKEQYYSVPGLVVRTLEPYLDLKKGLGTKRWVLPKKWDDPLPDVPENEPERFLGKDLEYNYWIQDYETYDHEQEFNGELSVYTTNHFIDGKDTDLTKTKDHRKKLDNAPTKCYLITGVQIMSDYKPTVDFIKICKKHTKTIDIVSTETIWAQPNRLYEFRTPIIFNPDMDIIFQFTHNKTWADHIGWKKDNIMIHGWVCEPLGKTVMG